MKNKMRKERNKKKTKARRDKAKKKIIITEKKA